MKVYCLVLLSLVGNDISGQSMKVNDQLLSKLMIGHCLSIFVILLTKCLLKLLINNFGILKCLIIGRAFHRFSTHYY